MGNLYVKKVPRRSFMPHVKTIFLKIVLTNVGDCDIIRYK